MLAKLLAALLAFTMIAAACGSDDDGDAGTDASGSDSAAADDSAEADADAEGEAVTPTITEPEAEEMIFIADLKENSAIDFTEFRQVVVNWS